MHFRQLFNRYSTMARLSVVWTTLSFV